MENKLAILKLSRTIFDVLIILAIFIDLLVRGLNDWLLITIILFVPSNILYFAIKYYTAKIKKTKLIKKSIKKTTKSLVIVR